jgi:hypothetical protein
MNNQDKELELLKKHLPGATKRVMAVFLNELQAFELVVKKQRMSGTTMASFIISLATTVLANGCRSMMMISKDKNETWHGCIMPPLVSTLNLLMEKFDVDMLWEPQANSLVSEVVFNTGPAVTGQPVNGETMFAGLGDWTDA